MNLFLKKTIFNKFRIRAWIKSYFGSNWIIQKKVFHHEKNYWKSPLNGLGPLLVEPVALSPLGVARSRFVHVLRNRSLGPFSTNFYRYPFVRLSLPSRTILRQISLPKCVKGILSKTICLLKFKICLMWLGQCWD